MYILNMESFVTLEFIPETTMKLSRRLFQITSFFCLGVFIDSCSPSPKTFKQEGQTMGTTYHVNYTDSFGRNHQPAIDSLLERVNLSMSTYIDSSLISIFNLPIEEMEAVAVDEHFENVFIDAKEVYQLTNGAFDPTVMPLVDYWGFGVRKYKEEKVDSSKIDVLLSYVNFDTINMEVELENSNRESGFTYWVNKPFPGLQLDFSAIAKGYGVDLVARFLESNSVTSYLVEIGGETKAKGTNPKNETWRIGIDRPMPGSKTGEQFQTVISLDGNSLATSGNYRQFYEQDARKYVHTINPKTGYPEISNLLSATVMMESCTKADAYATAFMVMGLEKSLELAKSDPAIEAYFIYADSSSSELKETFTDGIKDRLRPVN